MVAVTAVHLACIGAREIGSERTAFCIVVLDHEGTRHRRAYPGPALPQRDADLGDTSWVRSTERPNASSLAPNREPIASGDPALRFYPDDTNKIVMVALDLLYLNGYDLRKLSTLSASARALNVAGQSNPMALALLRMISRRGI
jgi:hypothetical protein